MPKCVICNKIVETSTRDELMALAWADGWRFNHSVSGEPNLILLDNRKYVEGICPDCQNVLTEKMMRLEFVKEAKDIIQEHIEDIREKNLSGSTYVEMSLLYVQTSMDKLVAGNAAVKQEEQKIEKVKTRFDYISETIRGEV